MVSSQPPLPGLCPPVGEPAGAGRSDVATAGRSDVASPVVAAAVDVRLSARRRRTVTAYRAGGRIVVLITARFSKAEERRWVDDMLARLTARERRAVRRGDAGLEARAHALSERYLGGRARPASVRWVATMTSRWASCTPLEETIRVSNRLEQMPGWVLDYVLVHELAHLLVAGHDDRFWSLVAGYPRAERARGYLEGVAAATGLRFDDADGAGCDPAREPAAATSG
ncbi:MAG: M48 metallopeptidase family protein [Mycobacteriales bacterium]